ncbi:MAG: tRNA (adenosine(37)-N6)-threonylcarbamoyltransferase complex ATPase subunit type 1 TsaE [Pseudomonadota bacterium]
MQALTLQPEDEAAMVASGARIAAAIEGGLVVYLSGDLGMGKTTLARGIVQGLGHQGAVKSPTYTLVEPYFLRSPSTGAELKLYHFDLYRLGAPEELEFIGIWDYFNEQALCLVEWPERGLGALPPADIRITIEREGNGRRLHLMADSHLGQGVLRQLQASS